MIAQETREHFLQQNIRMRLGHLASDLARIANGINITGLNVAKNALEHSQAFIEWIAPDLLQDRFDDAARLVEIQRALTLWHSKWNRVQENTDERTKLAIEARAWSAEVLKMSGLLDQE
ncbi:MAG: hypothetical protein HY070_12445 [Chloroflexi bacterium]|nr:hypothetical protein [Chloroflexota bacterium]MBI3742127.1 hypothetical protein [Chloroflexota bacterium]